MRKQTKLVAVLSAAALLAIGASMTSFAAGWQKSDDGTWSYYDRDDEMVTGEWQKDGSKWFYLDDDGVMLTDSWVDDEYYVGDDGAMLINAWKKTTMEDSVDDPDTDGDSWFYFGSKGKKVNDDYKKIGGKTYYFDADGKMNSGWFERDGDIYYLGGEDEGGRAEGKWLWLEKPGLDDEENDEAANYLGCSDDTEDGCDDEGWYWFASSGKMERSVDKKKVNGKTYYFNVHGQMLYEWINDRKVTGVNPASQSHAALDGSVATPSSSQIDNMLYSNQVEEGWRADGWYEIDGAQDTGKDGDTNWYYFKDGRAKRAEDVVNDTVVSNDDGKVYVARIKVDSAKGKQYFAFNEFGQMKDGLQYVPDDRAFYFFDESGYMKTGKVSNVENDDDNYEFYFNTTNGKNGQGFNGDKSGYLYFNGKKLTADDDYRMFFYNGKVYLVNNKGKIQKNNKKYDIENPSIDEDKVLVTFNSDDSVKSIRLNEGTGETYLALDMLVATVGDFDIPDEDVAAAEATEFQTVDGKYSDRYVSIPFIQLYDDDVYTYAFDWEGMGENKVKIGYGEAWYDVHINDNAGGWVK